MLKGQVQLWHAYLQRARGNIVTELPPLAAPSGLSLGASNRGSLAERARKPSDLMLSAGFAACAEWKRKTNARTEETAKEHGAVIRMAIEAAGEVDVGLVDPPLARKIIERLVSTPANAAKGSTKAPSKTTIAKRVSFLRSVFKWLESQHYVESDPFAKLSAAVPKPEKQRRESFTREQVASMVAALSCESARTSRFWLLPIALHTGARLAELAALP